MGWTFKTENPERVVELTDDQNEHNPDREIYYDETISLSNCTEDREHPVTGEYITRITVMEANELRGVRLFDIDLRGHDWPDKERSMADKQRKALEKNPMHTTMNDYKFGNPGSVPERARKKNMKRLAKKKIQVKKNDS